jgi:chloramphenicol O-acetyltransferase type A
LTGGLDDRSWPHQDGWHDERMDAPAPIDLDTWPRRQHFEHYRRLVPCTYSMTVELDATAFVAALRHSRRKTYIAQVWALSTVVNRHDEFKMCLTASGEPAVWPVVHPAFTVFNPERETFACVWAPYDPDFDIFHDVAAALLAEHSRATEFFPQGAPPANTFDVSSLPWASFTGFNLNIGNNWDHFAPIFTLGRYTERDGRVLLPLAVQVHHAAADGFHSARLVNELQAVVADTTWLEQSPKS